MLAILSKSRPFPLISAYLSRARGGPWGEMGAARADLGAISWVLTGRRKDLGEWQGSLGIGMAGVMDDLGRRITLTMIGIGEGWAQVGNVTRRRWNADGRAIILFGRRIPARRRRICDFRRNDGSKSAQLRKSDPDADNPPRSAAAASGPNLAAMLAAPSSAMRQSRA